MGLFKEHPNVLGWDGWIQKSQIVLAEEAKTTDAEIQSRIKCFKGQLKPYDGDETIEVFKATQEQCNCNYR